MTPLDPVHVDSLLDILSVAGGVAASVVAVVVLWFNSRTSALKATVDTLVSLNKALEARIDDLEKRYKEMSCENDTLRKEYSELDNKYNDLKTMYRVAQETIASLQRRVDELEAENIRLRSSMQSHYNAEA